MSDLPPTMQIYIVPLLICLLGTVLGAPTTPERTPGTAWIQEISPNPEATLDDMFREVEELMGDTQHKLKEAAHQMDEEVAERRSGLHLEDLPPNYHNESTTDTKIGNFSVHTIEKIDKVTDNKTGETFFSHTWVSSSSEGKGNELECIVDEDCGKGNYCQFDLLQASCLPCKTEAVNCTKDSECCEGHLCAWGLCSASAVKGGPGSICEYQNDCSSSLCCAFHKALLFPVCTPLPQEGERCLDPSNPLLDLGSWDLEPEGAQEHCQCMAGLRCQLNEHGPVCERKDSSQQEDEPALDWTSKRFHLQKIIENGLPVW
ncbi:DKK3 protein, partial [Polypterus senegalus]|nr:dickkopf-related protein 3-like [Polypterus senegalus]MBN3291575.1 DKK3 protein [Polypterus senegalus]